MINDKHEKLQNITIQDFKGKYHKAVVCDCQCLEEGENISSWGNQRKKKYLPYILLYPQQYTQCTTRSDMMIS